MGKSIIAFIVSAGLLVCLLLATNRMESLNLRKTHGFIVNRTGPNSMYPDRVNRACTERCEKENKGVICGPDNDAYCCPQGSGCSYGGCKKGREWVLKLTYSVHLGGRHGNREKCYK